MTHDLSNTAWNLKYSTFPMWQRKSISDVSFNYTAAQKKGKPVLLDEVKYHKNGKLSSIKGIDYLRYDNGDSYTWRGAGILFFVINHWKVEWMSAERDCIIVSFEKSIFTPHGVDLLTKAGVNVSQEKIERGLDMIVSMNLLHDVKQPLIAIP